MAFGTKQRVEDPFVQVLSNVVIIQTNGLLQKAEGRGSICSGAFKSGNYANEWPLAQSRG